MRSIYCLKVLPDRSLEGCDVIEFVFLVLTHCFS